MLLCSLILFIVACCTLYYYSRKKLRYFEELGVPYIAGWPLLGNMASIIFRRKHISTILFELYNAHPEAKYVGIFNLTKPVLLLRDVEAIKSVAIKNFDNFPCRQVLIMEKRHPLFGTNIFSMYGEQWKEARNIISPAFTSSKIKGMYVLMLQCVMNVMNYLDKMPENERKDIGTKDLFMKCTNDAIAACAYGIEINSLNDPNNEFYVNGKQATDLNSSLTLKLYLNNTFPYFMRLVYKYFKVQLVSEKICEFYVNLISSIVKRREEQDVIGRPDMIQMMMDARGKNHIKHLKLDLIEMTTQAFTFYFGGFETTSTQMCAMAHELAINPDIQKKLQDEINEVMERTGGNPAYEDIQGMTYLDAVIHETLRKHPPFPYTDRVCVKSLELPPSVSGGKPFIVPVGMNVWIPIASVHKDSRYHDNPEIFDPERYLDKKNNFNDVTSIPFGVGPKYCIGSRFVLLQVKILFTHILSKYNLRPNEKTCSPLQYSEKSFNVNAKGGFWLNVERR